MKTLQQTYTFPTTTPMGAACEIASERGSDLGHDCEQGEAWRRLASDSSNGRVPFPHYFESALEDVYWHGVDEIDQVLHDALKRLANAAIAKCEHLAGVWEATMDSRKAHDCYQMANEIGEAMDSDHYYDTVLP